jgi:adenylate kinase family enzyme
MKITIVGCPGSGKSTLASRLHSLLKIPIFHLDQYFWQPGWQRPDRDEFIKIHAQLCDKEEWILEGMAIRLFDYRIKQADVVIFLDVPLYVCLYRIFKRALLDFGKVRDSSAADCPERWPDYEFLSYVWNFRKKQKPEIEALIEHYKGQKQIFVVKTKADIQNLIKYFEKKGS